MPPIEEDQRNWHAHLLATTRKVTAGALCEKCEIELSDAKRLSLGLASARIEVEAVRQMWAEEVNRQLTQARRPERVDHAVADGAAGGCNPQGGSRQGGGVRPRTLGEARLEGGADGAPRVSSDRGNQLRQVRADNAQRKAEVVNIGQLRSQLARRQTEEATGRQERSK